jgi:hypothetical protein
MFVAACCSAVSSADISAPGCSETAAGRSAVVGQLGRFLERAWFFEQVRGTWDSYKACLATEILHGLAIEVDDEGIASADDEKHWLAYLWQALPSSGRLPRQTTARAAAWRTAAATSAAAAPVLAPRNPSPNPAACSLPTSQSVSSASRVASSSMS